MADSSVPITAGSGTNIDTRTDSAGNHRQVVGIGTDGDNLAHVETWGQLHVTQGPGTLFYDDFSVSTLNTADLWTVASGATPSTASSAGYVTMPNTVSTYNAIRSQDVMPTGAGFCDMRWGVVLDGASAATGAGRFWGAGTPATTPSATSLVQDGIGFEVDQTTGALYAVTYASGARTTVATLTKNNDAGDHRYVVAFRVTQAYWYVDGMQVAVANLAWPNLSNADLPLLLVRNNAASFTNGPTIRVNAVFAADTGRDGTMIGDGVVGARRARVVEPARVSGALTQSTGNDRTVGAALNVNPNAIQKATYKVALLRTTGPAYTAGTIQWHLSLHHLATATKTVRIRRILVGHAIPPVTTTGAALIWQLHRVTAAPTGTALAAGSASATAGYLPTDSRSAAGDATALSAPTVTSAGLLAMAAGAGGVTTHNAMQATLYDWQEGGETMPITLRAGVLEGIAIGAVSTAAIAATANVNVVSVEVTFTEE